MAREKQMPSQRKKMAARTLQRAKMFKASPSNLPQRSKFHPS